MPIGRTGSGNSGSPGRTLSALLEVQIFLLVSTSLGMLISFSPVAGMPSSYG